MGIIIPLYIQQPLASLLQQLSQDSKNLNSMTQTVRDTFAMSSKVLDQMGRIGALTIHKTESHHQRHGTG